MFEQEYTPVELAYLAGIMDGEGSFCTTRISGGNWHTYQ